MVQGEASLEGDGNGYLQFSIADWAMILRGSSHPLCNLEYINSLLRVPTRPKRDKLYHQSLLNTNNQETIVQGESLL